MRHFWILCAACSAPAAPAVAPTPPPSVAIDAAVAAAAPDAGVPDAVANAPAWIFGYHTAQRTEIWTLRYSGEGALVVVESARGAIRYLGSAIDGTTLAIDVATSTAKVALSCKHAKRSLGAKCNDKKAPPVDVLDCYVAGYTEPMPFGLAPGIEYVADDACTGYRLRAP